MLELKRGMEVTIVNIEHNSDEYQEEYRKVMEDVKHQLQKLNCLYTKPFLANGRYIQFLMKPSVGAKIAVDFLASSNDISVYFYTGILDDVNKIEPECSFDMNGPLFWAARDEIDMKKGKFSEANIIEHAKITKAFEDLQYDFELWGDQMFEYAFRTVAEKYGDKQALKFMEEVYLGYKKGYENNE